jgi:ferric-dicitrate binding protein FerR (iron transport regulator)
MGRKYNVDISFGDDQIKTSSVTGIFKNETVDQALKILQMITPFKYKINQNKIIILSSGPGE